MFNIGWDIGVFLKVVGSLGGAIAGGWKVWTSVIKPYNEKRKEEKAKLHQMISNIYGELRFNGGSSIKDAIWELKTSTEKILTRLGDIDEQHRISMNLQGTAFWISDENGGCTYASPALCRLTGHSEADILGNNWVSWVLDKEKVFEAWNFSVENRTVFDEVYTFKRADGKYQKVLGLCFHKTVNGEHSGSLGKLEPVGEVFS